MRRFALMVFMVLQAGQAAPTEFQKLSTSGFSLFPVVYRVRPDTTRSFSYDLETRQTDGIAIHGGIDIITHKKSNVIREIEMVLNDYILIGDIISPNELVSFEKFNLGFLEKIISKCYGIPLEKQKGLRSTYQKTVKAPEGIAKSSPNTYVGNKIDIQGLSIRIYALFSSKPKLVSISISPRATHQQFLCTIPSIKGQSKSFHPMVPPEGP